MTASPESARYAARARRQKARRDRRRVLVAVFIAVLTGFLLLMLIQADSSSAVSKAWANRSAGAAQRQHCGDGFWWVCSKSLAPAPFCYYAGRGAWNCWGGVTQRHATKWWRYRNCATYTYVAGNGRAINNGLYGCR